MKKVKEAALKVRNGDVLKNHNSLRVLDFGGSLGSSYFQNCQLLHFPDRLEWNIVEQPDFVQEGQKNIADDRLQFFYSVEECIQRKSMPDLLIISCVLPYLETPYEILNKLMSLQVPHFLIDNSFFNYEEYDRLTVQNVPPVIYEASYPCWFL